MTVSNQEDQGTQEHVLEALQQKAELEALATNLHPVVDSEELRRGLAGPSPAELKKIDEEAEVAKAAKEAALAKEKPLRLKPGLTVLPVDIAKADQDVEKADEALQNTQAEREALGEALANPETFQDRFILTGAIQLAEQALVAREKGLEARLKQAEDARKLDALVETIGRAAGEAILNGFNLPDVPVVVSVASVKAEGPRIEILVSSVHTLQPHVGRLQVNWIVPSHYLRPIASEVQQALAAGGVGTASGDFWSVSGSPRDLGDGLKEITYRHGQAVGLLKVA